MQPSLYAGKHLPNRPFHVVPHGSLNRRLTARSAFCALVMAGLVVAGEGRCADGRSQVHATIGQPLSIAVPLRLAGTSIAGADVQVEPAPGLPDAEKSAAESIVATYDPLHSQVRLTTAQRVTVPMIRLHLSVNTEVVDIAQDVDVLVDLPDFNKPAGGEGVAGQAAASNIPTPEPAGITMLDVRSERAAHQYGDSATLDGAGAAAGRPVATPEAAATLVAQASAARDGLPAKRRTHGGTTPPAHPATAALQDDKAVNAQVAAHAGERAAPRWFDRLGVRLSGLNVGAAMSSALALDSSKDPRPGAFSVPLLLAIVAAALLMTMLLRLYRQRRVALPARPTPRTIERAADHRAMPGPIAAGRQPDEEREVSRLRRMVEANPSRSDLRFQLVQRLYKAGDAATFSDVALPLKQVVTEDIWLRVQAMGRELLPGDERFSDQPARNIPREPR